MYKWEKAMEQKIVMKLLTDPNSISTTLLINPEILNDFSPTIPDKFPKELIPKDKCETQIKSLVSCMLDNNFDNVQCEDFQFKYFECKKWRDALIFKRIKEWESEIFKIMKEEDKIQHIDTLKLKKMEYIDLYEKIEVTPSNRNKKIRVTSDIEQLSWRIKYLESLNNDNI